MLCVLYPQFHHSWECRPSVSLCQTGWLGQPSGGWWDEERCAQRHATVTATVLLFHCLFFISVSFKALANIHCFVCSVTGGGYWVPRSPRERERPPLALLGGILLMNIKVWLLTAGWHAIDQPVALLYCMSVYVWTDSKPVCLLQLWLQRGREHGDWWVCVATATETDKLWEEHSGLRPIHQRSPQVGTHTKVWKYSDTDACFLSRRIN